MGIAQDMGIKVTPKDELQDVIYAILDKAAEDSAAGVTEQPKRKRTRISKKDTDRVYTVKGNEGENFDVKNGRKPAEAEKPLPLFSDEAPAAIPKATADEVPAEAAAEQPAEEPKPAPKNAAGSRRQKKRQWKLPPVLLPKLLLLPKPRLLPKLLPLPNKSRRWSLSFLRLKPWKPLPTITRLTRTCWSSYRRKCRNTT